MKFSREPLIATDHVSFGYSGDARERTGNAVDGVSVRIHKGEFIALVGRNGSGKSSFARLLNALLRPTGGHVWVKGIDTCDETRIWEIRQSIGMVFQDPDSQIVGSTVEEDVAFGPENLGLSPDLVRTRVQGALQAVAMTGNAATPPRLLSGGEKQRLSIAGVIAMQPECIVLDEATALLDAAGRTGIMTLVRKLNREEGLTVVHITHDMEEAALADRVIVMDAGRVVLDGTPGAVFASVSQVREAGLDLPQVTELLHELRLDGFDLPHGIMNHDAAVESLISLCQDGHVDQH